ncbi:MOSC domain-containing protein [Primorskyibacter sp. 2E233]|uniref:MOSC domain-containing protein n=1 Tax=Primorskyibacter sp. 2E233 TaxID=3413431 RepID=UPI003BEF6449
MTISVTDIWRFPIKSHGRESVASVNLSAGHALSPLRWRGNIWFDGAAAWEEFDWIDKEIQIGEAVLRVRERTDRCLATHNNPETGLRDHDVLRALDTWGHRDFSVRAEVIRDGRVSQGDKVIPL